MSTTDCAQRRTAHVFAQVTVRDHVKSAGGEPEVIRIDFAPARAVARGGVIAHLHRAPFVNRLRNQIDGLLVFTIMLVGTETDGKHLLHGADVLETLGGSAAAALFSAELSDSAISVPSRGFSRLRLRSIAISSVAEKPSAGISRKPSMSRPRVWPLCFSLTRGKPTASRSRRTVRVFFG